MGGGRVTIEDTVDHAVGFVITVKPGDRVRESEPIASVFARDQAGLEAGLAALREAITVAASGSRTPLITHRVTAAGVEPLAGEAA
jgi:thymidine phosphorylase